MLGIGAETLSTVAHVSAVFMSLFTIWYMVEVSVGESYGLTTSKICTVLSWSIFIGASGYLGLLPLMLMMALPTKFKNKN